MEKVLNLCELLPYFEKNGQLDMLLNNYKRIYIGSYFCQNMFFKTATAEIISLFKGKKLTLVVPILSSEALDEALKIINDFQNSGSIDEIVANDFGMLNELKKVTNEKTTIIVGRLLTRQMRDTRYSEFSNSKHSSNQNNNFYVELFNEFGAKRVEFDNAFSSFDARLKNFKTDVHKQYFYQTTGQICEFASVYKQTEKKFRPFCSCNLECQKFSLSYQRESNKYFKIGKTVFAETDGKNNNANREIYFPLKEWLQQ